MLTVVLFCLLASFAGGATDAHAMVDWIFGVCSRIAANGVFVCEDLITQIKNVFDCIYC
jgi:hypothetical protein